MMPIQKILLSITLLLTIQISSATDYHIQTGCGMSGYRIRTSYLEKQYLPQAYRFITQKKYVGFADFANLFYAKPRDSYVAGTSREHGLYPISSFLVIEKFSDAIKSINENEDLENIFDILDRRIEIIDNLIEKGDENKISNHEYRDLQNFSKNLRNFNVIFDEEPPGNLQPHIKILYKQDNEVIINNYSELNNFFIEQKKILEQYIPRKLSTKEISSIIAEHLPNYAKDVFQHNAHLKNLQLSTDFLSLKSSCNNSILQEYISYNSSLTRVDFLSFFYRCQVYEIKKLQNALCFYGTDTSLSCLSRDAFNVSPPLINLCLFQSNNEKVIESEEHYPLVDYDEKRTISYLKNLYFLCGILKNYINDIGGFISNKPILTSELKTFLRDENNNLEKNRGFIWKHIPSSELNFHIETSAVEALGFFVERTGDTAFIDEFQSYLHEE